MDNTLVKSNKIHIKAFNKSFLKAGLKKVPAKKLVEHFGKDKALVVKGVYPNLKKEKLIEILYYHNSFVIKETAKHIKLIRGVKKALFKLKKMGFKLALLSNCSHAQMEVILKHAKIDKRLFSILVGADEVKHSKPSPDEIIKAKKQLKAKSCFMIGDSIYDILAGKKAKVKTISVLTGDHTKKMLMQKKPDYIIKSVAKLPQFMKKLKSSS
ncbi:MAG: HAD family hydrolase [Nanoarchaeota archaeon]|nr:HAD family hydrolase [Nanoarchaeota archaeon]